MFCIDRSGGALGEAHLCKIDSLYSSQRGFQNTFFGLHTRGVGREKTETLYFPKRVYNVAEKTRHKAGNVNNPRDYEISA